LNYFNYFSEIEDTFIRCRGKGLLLSPFDWALMEVWQERQIPLHIVLRGIEIVFENYEKNKTKKRTIKGLSFCREEVEVQFSEWQESQIGKSLEHETSDLIELDDSFSLEKISKHIETVIEILSNSKRIEMSETFSRAIERLNDLKKHLTENFEQIEASLSDIENLISVDLKQNADIVHLKSEIEKQMKVYKSKMETEVYLKTFDIMLLKKLREEYDIPRLSLFYL
jgi:hypothetical protein